MAIFWATYAHLDFGAGAAVGCLAVRAAAASMSSEEEDDEEGEKEEGEKKEKEREEKKGANDSFV